MSVAALAAVGGGIVVAIVFVVQASRRPPDAFEVAVFQIVTLVLSFSGALILGGVTSEAEATRRVRQQAKPAFRRLVSILTGLGHIAEATDAARVFLTVKSADNDGRVEVGHVEYALDQVAARVKAELEVAPFAIDDWEDLAPDEVRELKKEAVDRESAG